MSNKLSEIIKSLGQFAPKFAVKAVGLPRLTLIETLGEFLFGKKNSTIEEIHKAFCQIGLTNEQKLRFMEEEIKALQIAEESQRNAREREIKLRDAFPRFVATTIILGVASMLICFFIFPVPEDREFIQGILQGFLGPALLCVAVYYFGMPPVIGKMMSFKFWK